MNRFKSIIYTSFFLLILNPLTSQSEETRETEEQAQVQVKIEPQLPETNPALIFIEGEAAVSTNFNREPVLNYSASRFRTLQLNQSTPLQEGSSYNADYVFYVEEDGLYEFWYGGTPPGHRNELLSSYASPFRYTLDGTAVVDVYREDMNVVSEYAPAYYWNYVKEIPLSAGEHRIKIEVLSRRSYDNKYFFYLDNFFFLKKEKGQRVLADPLPQIFPEDLDDRSIDSSFLSIEEYEVLIRDNPEEPSNYIYLAKIYTLIGDNLNALKYLRKAAFLEPDDPEIMLLMAKNLIWRGAVSEGLAMYRDLLAIVPERSDIWTEAGKISAWVGLYYDSIAFFEEGLENKPGDLSLMTNLAITRLWLGDVNGAEKLFDDIALITGEELELNRDLAEILRVNGYSDRASLIYRDLMNQYPEAVQLYFDLEETYGETDQRDKIEEIRQQLAKTFIENPAFNKTVDAFYNKQNMRQNVLDEYEAQLRDDPDNLILRKTLAEIYFWNGFKKEAISEYRNILTNHTYLNLLETENDLSGFLELMDKNYILSHFMSQLSDFITGEQRALSDSIKAYITANTKVSRLEQSDDEDKREELVKARSDFKEIEETLGALIYKNESFVEKYRTIESQFSDDTENLMLLLAEQDEENKTFDLLLEGVDWEWDRTAMLTELRAVQENGVILGDFVLGKIAQYEGRLDEARIHYYSMDQSETKLEGGAFALYQSEIWLNNKEGYETIYRVYGEDIDNYCPYVFYLNDNLDYISLEDEEESYGFITGDAADSVQVLLEDYKSIKSASKELIGSIETNIRQIRKALLTRMEQGFYRLASETYLLRNELGDFYYNEKLYPQGIDQFKQVLAIDPWNLSAKFKLAQVYQLNRDTDKALAIYKDIYNEDPQYNNVASFHNVLAREAADSLNFSFSSFSDSSSLTFDGSASYYAVLSKILEIDIQYDIKHQRKYRIVSPLIPNADYSSTLFFQKPTLQIPITLGPVRLYPNGSVYLVSELADIDDKVTTLEIVTPGDLIEKVGFFFRGGAHVSVYGDYLSVKGGYGYEWIEESLHPDNDNTAYHGLSLDLGLNLFQTRIPFIENSFASASGRLNLITDENVYWGASFLLGNNSFLRRTPEIKLNSSIDFSFEDAREVSTEYWTPDRSLKTGITLGMSFANSLLYEQFWLGMDFYGSEGFETMGLSFEAGNRFEIVNNDFTAYFHIAAGLNKQLEPDLSGVSYWSISIEAGVNALFPDYLKP